MCLREGNVCVCVCTQEGERLYVRGREGVFVCYNSSCTCTCVSAHDCEVFQL